MTLAETLLKNMNQKSQNYKVLNHMVNKGSITTYQAYNQYGITRLPARIADIEAFGIKVDRKTIWDKEKGKHWNEYSITN